MLGSQQVKGQVPRWAGMLPPSRSPSFFYPIAGGCRDPRDQDTQSGTRWGLIKSQQACGPAATPVTQLVLLSPASSGDALLPAETNLQVHRAVVLGD